MEKRMTMIEYKMSLEKMSKEQLYAETKKRISFAGFGNDPEANACYNEWKNRGNVNLFKEAYDEVDREIYDSQ